MQYIYFYSGTYGHASVWQSFTFKLKPAVVWATLCLPLLPAKDSQIMAAVQYRLISSLGMHCNIPLELRTMPEMYQALGMFYMNVSCIGANVNSIQCHWDMLEGLRPITLYFCYCCNVDICPSYHCVT